jgi:cytochrome c556
MRTKARPFVSYREGETMMKRFVMVVLGTAVVSALALLHQPGVQAEDAKCGEKGQPACPLEGWMEKNVQDPFDAKDLKTVAASLEKVAGFAPDPKWNEGDTGWSKLAKDGAAAAKAGNAEDTQKACKACHKAWRSKYKKEFRSKPLP